MIFHNFRLQAISTINLCHTEITEITEKRNGLDVIIIFCHTEITEKAVRMVFKSHTEITEITEKRIWLDVINGVCDYLYH